MDIHQSADVAVPYETLHRAAEILCQIRQITADDSAIAAAVQEIMRHQQIEQAIHAAMMLF
jgi:hypothetical protein